MNNSRRYTSYIARIAVLSALAVVIAMFETPLPGFPPFLQIDFSEIPVLLAAFALGPWSAVAVELIKNLLHLPTTSTVGIGEMANFLVGSFFAIPAGYIYKLNKNKKGAFIALSAGTVSMAVFAAIFNYFILLPLYAAVLKFPIDAIVAMGTKANGMIVSVQSLIAFAILPFNLIKGVIISVLVMLMYKKLSPLLHAKKDHETIGM